MAKRDKAPARDQSLAWAWNPDEETRAALSRGARKLSGKALGADKPHERGIIDLEEKTEMATKTNRKSSKRTSTKRTASTKKTPRKATAASAETKGKVPLKRICQKLGIDDKPARVKLRRAIANGTIKFHDHSTRWEFTQAQAKQVETLLK